MAKDKAVEKSGLRKRKRVTVRWFGRGKTKRTRLGIPHKMKRP